MEYISFYKICKEILDESGIEKDEGQFEDYRKNEANKFKEILKSLGVDPEKLKDKNSAHFKIPLKNAGIVKELVLSYTSPDIKKARKGNFSSIDLLKLESIIQEVDELLIARLDSVDLFIQRASLHRKTRYNLIKAITDVQRSSIHEVMYNIENMKSLVGSENEFLNDDDKAHLIRFYGHLIDEVGVKWKRIVHEFTKIREDEISVKSLPLNPQDQNEIASELLELDEPYLVLWEALQQYEDSLTAKLQSKMTKEQIDTIESIINENSL